MTHQSLVYIKAYFSVVCPWQPPARPPPHSTSLYLQQFSNLLRSRITTPLSRIFQRQGWDKVRHGSQAKVLQAQTDLQRLTVSPLLSPLTVHHIKTLSTVPCLHGNYSMEPASEQFLLLTLCTLHIKNFVYVVWLPT